jgi:hypothetical protein
MHNLYALQNAFCSASVEQTRNKVSLPSFYIVPMLQLQPPCTTEVPSNAHVFGFASMLSVLFNSGSCYFWVLIAIFSVIKFALHKWNVDKKEALENLNLILIVLCIHELVLRVNSS